MRDAKQKPTIQEFNPVDGQFFLVNSSTGALLAKTWNLKDARMVAAAELMLEALKDAHPHIADDRVRRKVGNAIAKATATDSETL